MPHVVYLAVSLLSPWAGCGYRIELIDFQLERMNDPSLYARVMAGTACDHSEVWMGTPGGP